MKRVAVVDIGTNSVKLLVASGTADGPRVERERVVITRLGAGLAARGRFTPAAMDRTLRAVRALVRDARRLGAAEVRAVGTAALRTASNRGAFRRRLRATTGLDLRVISGIEEAEWSFRGATHGLKTRRPGAVVVDVGGGSTEVAWRAGGRRLRISLPMGAVALTERHLGSDPIRAGEFRTLVAAIRRTLERRLRGAPRPTGPVIAVGGTAATLAAMQRGLRRYGPEDIHGTRLTRAQIYVWLVVLSLLPVRRRRELPGLEPARADIIVAGAAILAGVLSALRSPSLTVSARGLRHGLALILLAGPPGDASRFQRLIS